MPDSVQRFSSRVDNYVKYRPTYPADIVAVLADACGLTANSVIVDVGAGTGILSEMLLKKGNTVFAVEPNQEMRGSLSRLQDQYPSLRLVAGTAETTTLADASVDFVVAGQAFHWFDPERTRREFARILRPRGWVALVWNQRDTNKTAFLRGYEALLVKYAIDYGQFKEGPIRTQTLSQFFGPDGFVARTFFNEQRLDYGSLQGLLLSASFTPEEGHPAHAPMLQGLRDLFENHRREETVAMEYTTRLFYGRL